MSTKIHAVVDRDAYPLDWEVTPGQASDINEAAGLIKDKFFDVLVGDKGYDADALIKYIEEQGAEAVIPPRCNRTIQREYDEELYKERNRIERFFSRLKQNRRIATRYDKTDICFLAFIVLAAILIWLT